MYDRNTISAGIVHFGVGNFHRAHLQYYNNILLENEDQKSWGIYGAMIMPGDGPLYSVLKSEEGIYDLKICYPSGDMETHTVRSLIGLCWGEEDTEPIIKQIASPETKIITLTITEGGYVVNPDTPKSVFWYIAEGLKRRMAAGLPVTILSCDNLQHNGNTAANAFLSYFDAKYPEIASWARNFVSFPNSMVDRITPATKSGKITDVFCEDFIQWVVEDKFIAGRPAWERVGVQFTDDVTPYENMKLSLLNASHSLLCYPAYLEGFKKVDAVLADFRYLKLIKDFMDVDVTPYVPEPKGVNLSEYKETLLRRFSNAAISDQVSRLCGDGMAKFAVYIVPTLAKMLEDGKETKRLAFLLASYYKYLKHERTENGEKIDIFEPHISIKDKEILKGESPLDFFDLSPFAGLSLKSKPTFVTQYEFFVEHNVSEGFKTLDI
jgi:mannitol 2-dehydrogenase